VSRLSVRCIFSARNVSQLYLTILLARIAAEKCVWRQEHL
jgi:hypothetical protein